MRNITLTDNQMSLIREGFRVYLEKNTSLKTEQVYSDANYPYINNIGISYWDIFENDASLESARALLIQY